MNSTVTWPQTLQTIIYQNSMGSCQYTHLLLKLSLHPVTSVVLVGCAINVSMLCHHGDVAPLDMTGSLSEAKGMEALDIAQVHAFFSFAS